MIFCSSPYYYCEINLNGDVNFCCLDWSSNYKIGNIFKNSFEKIWKGKERKLFLEQFDKQNFKYCRTDICPHSCNIEKEDFYKQKKICSKDSTVTLRINYDISCNLKCKFCRQEFFRLSSEDIEESVKLYNALLKLLPELNKRKSILSLCGVGEAFFSKFHMNLIKEVTQNYNNINFSFITNGILCSEKLFKELKLEDRICDIEVSVHACTKETYNKMIKNGNFSILQNNLEYLSGLKKRNKINNLYFNFCVNKYNYHEMPDFAEWTISYGAIPQFLLLLKRLGNKEIFDEINVADKNNLEHQKFKEVLKSPILHSDKVIIPKSYLDL